jgi:hypothetical protein
MLLSLVLRLCLAKFFGIYFEQMSHSSAERHHVQAGLAIDGTPGSDEEGSTMKGPPVTNPLFVLSMKHKRDRTYSQPIDALVACQSELQQLPSGSVIKQALARPCLKLQGHARLQRQALPAARVCREDLSATIQALPVSFTSQASSATQLEQPSCANQRHLAYSLHLRVPAATAESGALQLSRELPRLAENGAATDREPEEACPSAEDHMMEISAQEHVMEAAAQKNAMNASAQERVMEVSTQEHVMEGFVQEDVIEASADSRPARKRQKQAFPYGNYNRYAFSSCLHCESWLTT